MMSLFGLRLAMHPSSDVSAEALAQRETENPFGLSGKIGHVMDEPSSMMEICHSYKHRYVWQVEPIEGAGW